MCEMILNTSVHNTVNVIVKNCTNEIASFMWRFDIWNSKGDSKMICDRLETYFECPLEFLNFAQSDMGREAIKRTGVERLIFEL